MAIEIVDLPSYMVDLSIVFGMFTMSGKHQKEGIQPRNTGVDQAIMVLWSARVRSRWGNMQL